MHSIVASVAFLSLLQDEGQAKAVRMFLDESIASFFRRLSFSPDGSLLVAPGKREEGRTRGPDSRLSLMRVSVCLCVCLFMCVCLGGRIDEGQSSNVTWIFTRDGFPRQATISL